MKGFLVKVVIFFAILTVFDYIWGITFDKLVRRIDVGGAGRDNFICNQVMDDIIIFGSSRAERHYNAQMISDSLGIPCYNCGEAGCGIILNYGRLLMLLERYTPKLIIYEVTPEYDYFDGKDNHKYLYRLKQHYDRKGIDSIFWDVDKTERYKMLSGFYRHNSSFLQNSVAYFLRISTNTGIKGFRPINGEIDTMKIRNITIAYDSNDGYTYDSLKIKKINQFIEKTKGIKTIFVVSPMWYGQDDAVLDTIKSICKKQNIPILDFANKAKYVHHNEYFKDGTHLNTRGADEFTRDVIKALRKDAIIE